VGSNVRQQSSGIGFGSKGADSDEITRDVRRALEATYRPEFLSEDLTLPDPASNDDCFTPEFRCIDREGMILGVS
jgi:hypothetical protein